MSNEAREAARNLQAAYAQLEAAVPLRTIDIGLWATLGAAVQEASRVIAAFEATKPAGEVVAWQCMGCAAITHSPELYIKLIQKGGGIACCPESHFVPYAALAASPVPSEAEVIEE